MYVKKLSPQAQLPEKATDGAAGLDLFSAEPCLIQPGQIQLVKTDISITCPPGTYGRIAPRSGLTIKRKLDVRADVVDSDYTGNVMAALRNIGYEQQELPSGSKIAQLIIEKIEPVAVMETTELSQTTRSDQGFESTDTDNIIHTPQTVPTTSPSPSPTNVPPPTSAPTAIPFDTNEIEPITDDDDTITPTVRSFSTTAANLFLSCDPFGPTTTVTVRITGAHPTLGFQLDHTITQGRLTLLSCLKGNPSTNLKKWRSTLRNGNPIETNGQPVSILTHVENLITEARKQQKPYMKFTFATEERVSIHNDSGTPQLYFDQLNAIAAYLQEIKYDKEFLDDDLETPILHLLKTKRKGKGMAQFHANS